MNNAINALADAIEKLAKKEQALSVAKDYRERATALSFEDAVSNKITDADFSYLNDKVSTYSDAINARNLAKETVAKATSALDTAKENYEKAQKAHYDAKTNTLIAKAIYDGFIARENTKNNANVDKNAETVEKDATGNKNGNTTIATSTASTAKSGASTKVRTYTSPKQVAYTVNTKSSGSPQTGDATNAGMYILALGASILVFEETRKKAKKTKR